MIVPLPQKKQSRRVGKRSRFAFIYIYLSSTIFRLVSRHIQHVDACGCQLPSYRLDDLNEKPAVCSAVGGFLVDSRLWPVSVQDLAEEQLGALVLRIVEEFGRRILLDDLSLVHED